MKTPDELIESKAAVILVIDGQEWIMRPTAAALMQMYADQVKSAKTTKTYPIICPSCKGAKLIYNPTFEPNVTGEMLYINCPSCNGTGVVICMETTEETIKIETE